MMWLPLVTVSLLVLGVLGDDPYLLVAREGGVDRLSLDGTGKRTVVTHRSVRAMAYDYSSGLLFYSTGRSEVRRSSQTGEDDQLLVDIYSLGLALDLTQNRLYKTNWSGGKIEVMDYSGQNRQTLVTGLVDPSGLVLDTDSRRMYWAERFMGYVKSAGMDGSNVTMLRQDQGERGSAVALDQTRGQLYWFEINGNQLHVLDLQTRADSVILSGRDIRGITQVRGKVISLIEGQATDSVDVSLSLPLIFFQTDSIQLSLLLEKQDSELRDHEKQVIDQVVVKAAYGSSSSSKITITDANWFEDHKFVIKAVQDGKTDGSQWRTLRVNMAKYKNGAVTEQTDVGKQDVSVTDRDTRSACR